MSDIDNIDRPKVCLNSDITYTYSKMYNCTEKNIQNNIATAIKNELI